MSEVQTTEVELPVVDQIMFYLRLQSSVSLLNTFNCNDSKGHHYCNKHGKSWGEMHRRIVCDDTIKEEYVIPTLEQIIDSYVHLHNKVEGKDGVKQNE